MNRLFLLAFTISAFSLSPGIAAANGRADMVRLFHDQLTACYNLPLDAKRLEPVVVEIRVKADGTLDGEPRIIEGPPKSVVAAAALRAIKKCLPFKIPSTWAPWKRQWEVMRIGFNPK
ncbi:energy transducer TonB [Microvirga sp. 2YAF29]|uniref:energy transducer TonB n=1 Tax=Microvirga sp. 2YAF29 TaxID=3233031 RepID=UPI003F9DD969